VAVARKRMSHMNTAA